MREDFVLVQFGLQDLGIDQRVKIFKCEIFMQVSYLERLEIISSEMTYVAVEIRKKEIVSRWKYDDLSASSKQLTSSF